MADTEKLKLQDGRFVVSGDGVFYTLQGEGVNTGTPAVFLRLHVCNLQCDWCDTKYTWDKKVPEFFTEPKNWTIPEAGERIKEAWGTTNPRTQKRLVVTGGEPLLQAKNIEGLLDELPDWKMEIETNGTRQPTERLLKEAQFNCSPKLENSQNSLRARLRPDVIERLKTGNTYFKFVVEKPEDVIEAERDYIQRFDLDPNRVIIMPEGTTSDRIRSHAQQVASVTNERGYRLMSRLHVELFGSRRGV